MVSMQSKLQSFYGLFAELDCDVTHFVRNVRPPYMVWAEQGEDESFHSDNHKTEQVVTGTIDYFTLTEFDEIVDDIQEILDDATLAWSLEAVQYEDETNLIHYTWRWEVS